MKVIRRKELRFPTMLRRMWSGGDVQDWIDANIRPLLSRVTIPHVHDEASEDEHFQAWWADHGQHQSQAEDGYLTSRDAWNACSKRIATLQAQSDACDLGA